MSLAFPFILANKNIACVTDTELTEKAPSADSAAAFSSLEIKMNNFTVRNKVKPLKLYCFQKMLVTCHTFSS